MYSPRGHTAYTEGVNNDISPRYTMYNRESTAQGVF